MITLNRDVGLKIPTYLLNGRDLVRNFFQFYVSALHKTESVHSLPENSTNSTLPPPPFQNGGQFNRLVKNLRTVRFLNHISCVHSFRLSSPPFYDISPFQPRFKKISHAPVFFAHFHYRTMHVHPASKMLSSWTLKEVVHVVTALLSRLNLGKNSDSCR